MSVDQERVVHGVNGDSVESIKDPNEMWNNSGGDVFVAGMRWLSKEIADQFIDEPHKMKEGDALDLVGDSSDLTGLGKSLHSLQDVYSHRMKPYLNDAWAIQVAGNHTFTNDC